MVSCSLLAKAAALLRQPFGLQRTAPHAKFIDDRSEAKTVVGELVLHADRHFRIYRARDEASRFKGAKIQCQHALRDPRHIPPQIAESLRAIQQVEHQNSAPSSAKHTLWVWWDCCPDLSAFTCDFRSGFCAQKRGEFVVNLWWIVELAVAVG